MEGSTETIKEIRSDTFQNEQLELNFVIKEVFFNRAGKYYLRISLVSEDSPHLLSDVEVNISQSSFYTSYKEETTQLIDWRNASKSISNFFDSFTYKFPKGVNASDLERNLGIKLEAVMVEKNGNLLEHPETIADVVLNLKDHLQMNEDEVNKAELLLNTEQSRFRTLFGRVYYTTSLKEQDNRNNFESSSFFQTSGSLNSIQDFKEHRHSELMESVEDRFWPMVHVVSSTSSTQITQNLPCGELERSSSISYPGKRSTPPLTTRTEVVLESFPPLPKVEVSNAEFKVAEDGKDACNKPKCLIKKVSWVDEALDQYETENQGSEKGESVTTEDSKSIEEVQPPVGIRSIISLEIESSSQKSDFVAYKAPNNLEDIIEELYKASSSDRSLNSDGRCNAYKDERKEKTEAVEDILNFWKAQEIIEDCKKELKSESMDLMTKTLLGEMLKVEDDGLQNTTKEEGVEESAQIFSRIGQEDGERDDQNESKTSEVARNKSIYSLKTKEKKSRDSLKTKSTRKKSRNSLKKTKSAQSKTSGSCTPSICSEGSSFQSVSRFPDAPVENEWQDSPETSKLVENKTTGSPEIAESVERKMTDILKTTKSSQSQTPSTSSHTPSICYLFNRFQPPNLLRSDAPAENEWQDSPETSKLVENKTTGSPEIAESVERKMTDILKTTKSSQSQTPSSHTPSICYLFNRFQPPNLLRSDAPVENEWQDATENETASSVATTIIESWKQQPSSSTMQSLEQQPSSSTIQSLSNHLVDTETGKKVTSSEQVRSLIEERMISDSSDEEAPLRLPSSHGEIRRRRATLQKIHELRSFAERDEDSSVSDSDGNNYNYWNRIEIRIDRSNNDSLDTIYQDTLSHLGEQPSEERVDLTYKKSLMASASATSLSSETARSLPPHQHNDVSTQTAAEQIQPGDVITQSAVKEIQTEDVIVLPVLDASRRVALPSRLMLLDSCSDGSKGQLYISHTHASESDPTDVCLACKLQNAEVLEISQRGGENIGSLRRFDAAAFGGSDSLLFGIFDTEKKNEALVEDNVGAKQVEKPKENTVVVDAMNKKQVEKLKDNFVVVDSMDKKQVEDLKEDSVAINKKQVEKPKENSVVVGAMDKKQVEKLKENFVVVDSMDKKQVEKLKENSVVVDAMDKKQVEKLKENFVVVDSMDKQQVEKLKENSVVVDAMDKKQVEKLKENFVVVDSMDKQQVEKLKENSVVVDAMDKKQVEKLKENFVVVDSMDKKQVEKLKENSVVVDTMDKKQVEKLKENFVVVDSMDKQQVEKLKENSVVVDAMDKKQVEKLKENFVVVDSMDKKQVEKLKENSVVVDAMDKKQVEKLKENFVVVDSMDNKQVENENKQGEKRTEDKVDKNRPVARVISRRKDIMSKSLDLSNKGSNGQMQDVKSTLLLKDVIGDLLKRPSKDVRAVPRNLNAAKSRRFSLNFDTNQVDRRTSQLDETRSTAVHNVDPIQDQYPSEFHVGWSKRSVDVQRLKVPERSALKIEAGKVELGIKNQTSHNDRQSNRIMAEKRLHSLDREGRKIKTAGRQISHDEDGKDRAVKKPRRSIDVAAKDQPRDLSTGDRDKITMKSQPIKPILKDNRITVVVGHNKRRSSSIRKEEHPKRKSLYLEPAVTDKAQRLALKKLNEILERDRERRLSLENSIRRINGKANGFYGSDRVDETSRSSIKHSSTRGKTSVILPRMRDDTKPKGKKQNTIDDDLRALDTIRRRSSVLMRKLERKFGLNDREQITKQRLID